MAEDPVWKYYLYQPWCPVLEGDENWRKVLPVSRHTGLIQRTACANRSIGEYFSAVRSFLGKNNCDQLKNALILQSGKDLSFTSPLRIHVCIVKHGEFYHPSKIDVIVNGYQESFVLNAALSDVGRKWIYREFRLLDRLNRLFSFGDIPKVYCQSATDDDVSDPLSIPMFLGEWFSSYNEFHLCRPTGSGQQIVVWYENGGRGFLSEPQVQNLYRQIALILTRHYNLQTYEQIWPWHHAAGDFIIKSEIKNSLSVKLITVRGYQALVQKGDNDDARSVLEALLFFLLNLSIRTRLDRFEGTGDFAWADDDAVDATLTGFFEGLKSKDASHLFGDPLYAIFSAYLQSLSMEDLYELARTATDAFYHHAPECQLVKYHLRKHVNRLYHSVRKDNSIHFY